MNLSLKGFTQLVEDMTATLQGTVATFIDVSAGSVLRAIFEANASVALWLQWLILQVLQTTRAATSTGSDLDTWMADFGLTRLPAVAANGTVMFSRFASTLPATIPVGSLVKTSDGTQKFSVTADSTVSTWQAALNSYVIPSGVTAATVPVTCVTAGSVGNVLAGTITIIATSLPGIDQVVNAAALTNGQDEETDPALRARFQSYVASLARGTVLAINTAAASVQQGINIAVDENVAPDGSSTSGSFLVTADDGSGFPPSTLLSSIATAIDAVRPVGTMFTVIAPQVATANVTMIVEVSNPALASQYAATIQQAVASYLNSLPIGASASVTRIAQNGYAASPDILNVSGILINGQMTDLTPPARTVIKAGQVMVTANGR